MRKIVVLLALLCPVVSFSQSDFSGGLLPRINASFTLADRLKLNSSIELRQQLFDQELGSEKQADFVLADWANTLSYKLRSNQKLNFGHTLRSRDQDFHHRFTQQFSVVNKKTLFRVGHRLGLDQTFIPDRNAVFRTRYRVSFERPLRGAEIDNKELYLKVNNEYLGIFTKENAEAEVRVVPYLGFEINSTNKVELGVDYRISDFTQNQRSHRLWLSMVYFTTF